MRCIACNGHGQVPHYTFDGSDFLGAKECGRCKGSGRILPRLGRRSVACYKCGYLHHSDEPCGPGRRVR